MDVNFDSITGIPSNAYDWTGKLSSNPVVLAFLVVVIIVYYILFASLGGAGEAPMGEGASASGSGSGGGLGALEVLMWGLFVVLVLTNGLQYFFNINLTASIKKLFSAEPEIDLKVTRRSSSKPKSAAKPAPPPKPVVKPDPAHQPQVYHVSDNKYTYNDAQAICTALNGDLATYDQIEDAYKSGAEWCGYGWSDGQMAYFPTQKSTFDNLQDIEGHEHDCGRPGINGGFIDNPNVRFGVNCYGRKPKETNEDKARLKNSTVYPKTQADIEQDKRVDYWRNKLESVEIAPFSHDNWNRI